MALYDAFGEGEFTLPIELSEEEIQDRQAKYFDNRRKVEMEERRLADAKAIFKQQTDPINKVNKILYKEITEGVVYKTLKAIEVPDEDQGVIGYFDLDGVKLYERGMTPSEKQQYRIKFGRKPRQMAD